MLAFGHLLWRRVEDAIDECTFRSLWEHRYQIDDPSAVGRDLCCPGENQVPDRSRHLLRSRLQHLSNEQRVPCCQRQNLVGIEAPVTNHYGDGFGREPFKMDPHDVLRW